MRAGLNSLAVAAPDWLAKRLKKDWFDRYGRRVENYRLPKLDSEREALGNQMGEDGFDLLKRIYAPNAPEWLRLIPAVEILRQVWVQQFYAPVESQVQWRKPKDMPPSTIAIHSPYDVEAHYSSKRSVNWVGSVDRLKNISQIEHSRHRSPVNFCVNVLCGLIAYCHQPKKPSLRLDWLLPQSA